MEPRQAVLFLRQLVDPDPAEPVAVRIGHDRSTGPIAKDAGVFPELAGITAFHDPEGRQEGQERPCEDGRVNRPGFTGEFVVQ